MIRLRLAAACAVVALVAGTARADVVERDVVDVAPAGDVTITAVSVDNRLGDVRVEGHDGRGITVLAVKRGPDDDAVDRLRVSLVPDPKGPVLVSTSLEAGAEARPIPAGSVRIDLVIRVPRRARVDATVWNGGIAVTGMEGGGELTANEGDIAVERSAGEFVTHAAEGRQRFVQVFGAVEAEGLSGQMDIDAVKGRRLDARLHDGDVEARRVQVREVVIRTTNGDIRFQGEMVEGGVYRLVSYRGDVDVTFRRGAAFRVEAMSRRGAVSVPRDLAVVRRTSVGTVGTYGGGHRPAGLFLQSRLGDVRLGLLGETP